MDDTQILLNNLQLKITTETIPMEFNGVAINVQKYLPVNKKLDLISWVINQSADDLKFYNVGKVDIFMTIGLIQNYTNIKFTEAELADIPTLYDKVFSSGLSTMIINTIPHEEYRWVYNTLEDTINSIYKYQNSVMGILDTVTTDYKDLNFDIEQLQKNISNPENLTLLKDVVTKLG